MKKGMAFLVGISMAVSGLCLQMPTAVAYDVPASTVIAEDGTIYTYTSHNNGYCMEEYAYPVSEQGAYIGECYDKDADYVVRVSCADAEAFTTAFSEQYQLTLLDDGDYIVTDSSDADYEYANFSDSEWTYTDADTVAKKLICSDAVQKVSVEKGYRRLRRGNIVQFTDVYWVYTDTDTVLTEDDFAWLGENATVENLAEIEELSDDNEIIYRLTLSKGNWYGNNWGLLRYFMTGCMEMPSVHAVNNSVIRNGLAVMYTYETEKVYQSVNDYLGDIDSDGTVSVEDAVSTLTYYAQQSAGLEAKLTQAADTEESAFLAADVDGDGQITVEDAVAILTYYAKKSAGLDAAW